MRKLVKQQWSGSHPGTNVLWMHYLADVLLAKKELPGVLPGEKRQLRDFRRRVLGYSNCGEVIWDELFKGLWWTRE
jgi:serine/threonine-protein kinase haspin